MNKRDVGSQFDFGERKNSGIPETPKVRAAIVPFVDAATMQVRRDAVRRVAATGIFSPMRRND